MEEIDERRDDQRNFGPSVKDSNSTSNVAKSEYSVSREQLKGLGMVVGSGAED